MTVLPKELSLSLLTSIVKISLKVGITIESHIALKSSPLLPHPQAHQYFASRIGSKAEPSGTVSFSVLLG